MSYKKNIQANIKKFFSNPEKETFLPYLILLTYLVIGSIILHDYGISMDEPIQRKHGIVSFDYVNERFNLFPDIPKTTDEDLQQYDHRDYGVIFQMFCYLIERKLNINNTRDIFVLRHIITFLLFWVAVYFFYKVAFLHFNDWRLATLGMVFFILSPRIFVEAFYNPKDIVLLSWMTIGYYTLIRFLRETTLKWGVLHGLITALAINARIVALILPALSITFLLIATIFKYKSWKIFIRAGITYISVSLLLTIAFWPFLWGQPFQNLVYVFDSMKQFRWNGTLLYWGNLLSSTDLPWHYTFSWIMVTIPVVYSILFLLGLLALYQIIIDLIHSKISLSLYFLEKYLFFTLFIMPVISIIIFQSILYHGWRHMYFIYPGFILIVLTGIQLLLKTPVLRHYEIYRKSLIAAILGVCFFVSYEMAKYHPYQYVYFNWLLGTRPLDKFDGDYYGLSYYSALQYLLKDNLPETINLNVSSTAGKLNQLNFQLNKRGRLNYLPLDSADFFISNFCFASNIDLYYSYWNDLRPFCGRPLNEIFFKKSKINAIYFINDTITKNEEALVSSGKTHLPHFNSPPEIKKGGIVTKIKK